MLYNYSIIKDFVLKHKRVIAIGSAVLFLFVLFLAKRTNFFERTVNFVSGGNRAELVYGDATVADLVNKDSDGDGIPDWEEPLWGLDPTKKETTPGVPDSTVISKLKLQNEYNLGSANGTAPAEENLTETDKFSRELFSTTAALSQNGVMDQTTVNKISDSLSEKIKNSVPRKVYTISDIKVVSDNSTKSIKDYSNALDNLKKKYPVKGYAIDVLKKFIIDENNVDISVLTELGPIIKQSQNIMNGMINTNVPSSIAQVHLDVINAIERTIENMADIQLFNNDPVVAMGAISKYKDNVNSLKSAFDVFANEINKKLND